MSCRFYPCWSPRSSLKSNTCCSLRPILLAQVSFIKKPSFILKCYFFPKKKFSWGSHLKHSFFAVLIASMAVICGYVWWKAKTSTYYSNMLSTIFYMLLFPYDLVLFYTWLGAPYCLVKIYDLLLLIISYQFLHNIWLVRQLLIHPN